MRNKTHIWSLTMLSHHFHFLYFQNLNPFAARHIITVACLTIKEVGLFLYLLIVGSNGLNYLE